MVRAMKKTTAPAGEGRAGFTGPEQLPNVGPAVAAFPWRVEVRRPLELLGRDPYEMFEELCRVTGKRHDPCLLDTFIAAVRFMGGEPAKPWWAYTAERKKRMADALASNSKKRRQR